MLVIHPEELSIVASASWSARSTRLRSRSAGDVISAAAGPLTTLSSRSIGPDAHGERSEEEVRRP
jgi:hypothetical protein